MIRIEKIILLLFLLPVLFSNSVIAQNDWYVVSSGTSQDLLGVRFYNADLGFAVGDSGIVLRSTNAGQNWSPINLWNGYSFFDVAISNMNIAVACGRSNQGAIVRTVNGGLNWTSAGYFIEPFSFYHIQFVNPNTGYAIGGPNSIYKSVNAGQSWSIVMRNTGYNLVSINFPSDSIGYAGGTAYANPVRAVILKTTNYGATWGEANTGILGDWARDIIFLNNELGFITVLGKIYKTTDGAASWSLSCSTNMLNSIYFLNTQTGYAAGDGGFIVKTTNSGANWSQMSTGTGSSLRDVYFINETTGIAVGYNGLILRTTSSLSGINPVASELPVTFSLSQNYPNPFNPNTHFKFGVPANNNTGIVNLSVYDIQGRLVETLINTGLQAGTYNVEWDASKYSSGVYFYSLSAGDFKEVKKMILLK